MSDSHSTPNTEDEIFGQFLAELGTAADKAAVIRKYAEAHPQWAEEFRELAAMEEKFAGSELAAPDPEPGTLPDFRILRRIAQGGMGVVYEAEQISLKRRVAVKVRRGQLAPVTRRRFLREQELLAQLHQTHIVPIHTAGQEGPWQYFAMAYIEGAALHHVVRTTLQEQTVPTDAKAPTLAEMAEKVLTSTKERAHASAPVLIPGADSSGAADSAGLAASSPVPVGRPLDFRSVAKAMLEAAEALQYAHNLHILHRDVKPSNIMVDTAGQCWLIDFGLACHANVRKEAGPLLEEEILLAGAALTRGPVGTPQYMAPEQFQGRADVRTDVWGLGVTLYELLTLRRAFDGPSETEIRKKIQSEEPVWTRQLVPSVPADLAAICHKAMQKDPGMRYPTVGEFGDDLRRWLHGESTRARPAWVVRRAWLWARRNKGWAAAIAGALLTAVALAGMIIVSATAAAAVAEAGKGEAEAREAAALVAVRAKSRELLLQQLQRFRLTTHTDGWSKEALDKVRKIRDLDASEDLRHEAAAMLIGLDARPLEVHKFGASSVAFDSTGQQLLIGGLAPDQPQHPGGERAKVWDRRTHRMLHTSIQTGSGPVAFRKDGTPLQLIANPKDRLSLRLWDMAKNQLIREFQIPGKGQPEPLTFTNGPTTALAADGSFLAASAVLLDGKPMLVVWDTGTGKMAYQSASQASSLALSSDNALLASGDDNGQITLRSLPDGEAVAALPGDRMAIQCLAFQEDRRRGGSGPRDARRWLLAAGDAGGTVTIWDCQTRVPRAVCRGSKHHVHAVAFSPDGMTLASGGRGAVKLWDIATGRLLLNLGGGHWDTDVAFSHEGRQLAISTIAVFGDLGRVEVWELEPGRGIQTLRGLASTIEKVTISPDNRLLAALAHDSRVAVWDLRTEHLLHVFEAPKVLWADNAALAFSPDSRQLAFAGSSDRTGQAKLWDVTTGEEKGSWTFSPGLNNILAFHPTGKLLLFQVETRDGKRLPAGDVKRQENPPVARVRDLRSDDPRKPLFQITEFNWHIDWPVAPADGHLWVVIGYQGDDQPRSRQIKAFDGLSGKEVWPSLPEPFKREEDIALMLDRTGRFLSILRAPAAWARGTKQATLVELPSGKFLGPSENCQVSGKGWSPEMPYWMTMVHPKHPNQISLVRRGQKDPVVALGIDVASSGIQQEFNASGTRFAWGNVDGTVNICDIPEVQKRLTTAGFDW